MQRAATPSPPTGAADLSDLRRIRRALRAFTHAPLSDLEARQFDMFFREVHLYGGIIALLFTAAAWVLWRHVPPIWIVLFLALFVVESALKLWVVSVWIAAPEGTLRAPVWRLMANGGALWSGLLYGVAALVLFVPMPLADLMMMATVFAVLVFIAVMAPPHYLPATLCMSLPLSLILPLVLLVAGSGTWQVIAMLQLAAFAFCVTSSVRANRRLTNLIVLDERNGELVRRLSGEKRVVEAERARAEHAVVDKSRFIATASHDLRQPLHALGLFQHALSRRCDTGETGQLVESLGRSTDQLNILLDSLLDVSRLDANAIEPDWQPVALGPLLRGLNEEFHAQALGKGLALDIAQTQVLVHSDPVLLNRILRNLLSNAIKFSEAGTISIAILPTDRPDSVLLTVQDHGPGIPLPDRERVFDAFYRRSEAQRTHGVGLGLSIVRRLSEVLGISVSLSSTGSHESGQRRGTSSGTRFTLQIPVGNSVPSATVRSIAAASSDSLRGLRVLVIDDETDILDGMRLVLERSGCEVDGARCLSDAIESLGHGVPDVILCDFQLGDGQRGLDVVARLRALAGRKLPAAILTGASSNASVRALERAGVDVLIKPVRPDDMYAAVAALARPLKMDERLETGCLID